MAFELFFFFRPAQYHDDGFEKASSIYFAATMHLDLPLAEALGVSLMV